MGQESGDERTPRRALAPLAAVVAVILVLGLGAAWTAAATSSRPGEVIDVAPVIDGEPLESPTPTPTPTPSPAPAPAPTPTPGPEPVPAPQPVPAPPPVDLDDDDDDDDVDDPDDVDDVDDD